MPSPFFIRHIMRGDEGVSQLLRPMEVLSRAALSRTERQANQLRRDVLRMIYKAGKGHPGGSLSAARSLALPFAVMRLIPSNPRWPGRDRFILSKGMLARFGMRHWQGAVTSMSLSRHPEGHGSILQGHPAMQKTLESAQRRITGQRLSQGLGMALIPALGLTQRARRPGNGKSRGDGMGSRYGCCP